MGLLSDALRHLLATDPAERRAGLAGLVGKMAGSEPVTVSHPSAPSDGSFLVAHFRKPTSGSRPRSYAMAMTLGLAESQQRELVALTLADVRDPAADRTAWLLSASAQLQPGGVAPLPEGCLGRSSHVYALCTEPWPMIPQDRADLEQLVGARLDLVVPITAREAAFAVARGAAALVEAMKAQGVLPWADRPAGQTELPAEPPLQ
jgi:hypothetical protein